MKVEEEEGRSLLKSQVSTARTRGNPREDSTRFFFFAIQIRSNSYSRIILSLNEKSERNLFFFDVLFVRVTPRLCMIYATKSFLLYLDDRPG